MCASWAHGHAVSVAVADEDLSKNSETQLEILSRTFDDILLLKGDIPQWGEPSAGPRVQGGEEPVCHGLRLFERSAGLLPALHMLVPESGTQSFGGR